MHSKKFKIKNSELVTDSKDLDFDYFWNDFDLSETKNQKALKKTEGIPEFALMALLSEETRPRVEVLNNGMLIVLRAINFNPEQENEDMVALRIWVQKDKIITCHYRPIQTLDDIKQQIHKGVISETASVMLANIVSKLFQKIEQTILELDDVVNDLEDQITDSLDQNIRNQISSLRKKIVIFKRHLLPQREVMSQLRSSKLSWLQDEQKNYHNENYERVMRNLEDLEVMRDKLNIIKEEAQYLLSDRLSKNTYILSIVAAIFLPLGFLTGLLGINVGGIPGTDNPNSFWIFCVVLVVVVILQAFLFRKMKWL